MYLGVMGMMPQDLRQVDADVVRRIRQAGFTGVSCRFYDPLDFPMPEVERLRTVLEKSGVRPAQANAQYPDLVHPDERQRIEGIRAMQRMCNIARALKAHTLYIRPGSLNPHGSWYPHPQNRSAETLERLITSLREVSKPAEDEGVTLAIEGHVLSPLYSAETVRWVIDAVGSPALRFNMDPVNFVGTLPETYDTTSLVNHLFDVLGSYTAAAHAKDFYLEERLVLHIEETVIGDGLLDQGAFLKGMAKGCPNGYVIIEHLPDEKIPQAKAALDRVAERLGIRWETP